MVYVLSTAEIANPHSADTQYDVTALTSDYIIAKDPYQHSNLYHSITH